MQPPRVDRFAARPPFQQIADYLETRVRAGDFQPLVDPLPSESQLTAQFGVGRDTARRAVRELRERGLAVTVPQRGTYAVPENRWPNAAPTRAGRRSGGSIG